jgi:outer membrane protein OmpA-like peptidoglycan-associated protein
MLEQMRPGAAAIALAACLPFAGGCATKAYVRERVGELGTQVSGENAQFRDELSRQGRTSADALGQAASARSLALGNLDYRLVQEYVVNFAFDSATLSDEARLALDDAATAVSGNPRALVDILGHADSTGPDAYNDELSRRRASAVLQYLVLHGPGPASRYAIVGLGETSLVLQEGLEDRPASRRVVVSLLERAEPGSGAAGSEPPVISRAEPGAERSDRP